MPGSFMKSHRTICEVLFEIRTSVDDDRVQQLCDEAIIYARRMSLKLTEYKKLRDKMDAEGIKYTQLLDK